MRRTPSGSVRVSRNASGCGAANSAMRVLVFGGEHRAGRIEQLAARREQRPRGVERGASCSRAKRSTSPARCRHLPSGCRRTTPDAVQGTSSRMRSNGRAVPPRCGAPGIALRRRARGDRASRRRVEVLARCAQAARRSTSSASRSTSARSSRCAVLPPGAAHASSTRMPSRDVEQRRRELRAEILHGERAVGESRQLGHRPRRRRRSRRALADGVGRNARGREPLQQRVARRDAPIDAQRQRRARVARLEDRLPVGRIVAPHAIDPPLRVRPARDVARRDRRAHVVALAQVAAQQRVDERLGAPGARASPAAATARSTTANARRARVIELVERDGDQRAQQRIGDRLSRELRRRSRRACPSAAACRRRAPARACGRAAGCRRRPAASASRRLRAVENARDGAAPPASARAASGALTRPARTGAPGADAAYPRRTPAPASACRPPAAVGQRAARRMRRRTRRRCPARPTRDDRARRRRRRATSTGSGAARIFTGVPRQPRDGARRRRRARGSCRSSAVGARASSRCALGARRSSPRRSRRRPAAASPAGARRARALPARRRSCRRRGSPAGRAACRPSRAASIATARVATIGPVSRPASICMIVMPVTASPASIARAIGAAPRQRGSSDAWMLRQPWRGQSRTAGGSIRPYAATTSTSSADVARAPLATSALRGSRGCRTRQPVRRSRSA